MKLDLVLSRLDGLAFISIANFGFVITTTFGLVKQKGDRQKFGDYVIEEGSPRLV